VRPADFAPPPNPAQTAEQLPTEAAKAFVATREFDLFAPNKRYQLPLDPDAVRIIEACTQANRQPLRLTREARSRPVVMWGMPAAGTRPFNLPSGNIRQQVRLIRLLGWRALVEHQFGNDHEAAELLLDLLHQERVLDHGPPSFFLWHLTALWASSAAAECTLQFSSDLLVAPNSDCTREQIRDILDSLMDGGASQSAAVRAWQYDRAIALDSALTMSRDTASDRLLRPMYVQDALRLADWWGRVANAAAQPNWPAATVNFPRHPSSHVEGSYLATEARPVSGLAPWTLQPRVQEQYRYLMDRYAAAIVLAIRLYALDHDGVFPPSLSELVPKYLPRVPTDPMAADNQPMRYRLDAQSPLVYSVGNNGVDDGGVANTGGNRWYGKDIIYPDRPTTRPVTTGDSSGSPGRRTPRKP
jgi:hypothetical protein